jgi:hypothetical protein
MRRSSLSLTHSVHSAASRGDYEGIHYLHTGGSNFFSFTHRSSKAVLFVYLYFIMFILLCSLFTSNKPEIIVTTATRERDCECRCSGIPGICCFPRTTKNYFRNSRRHFLSYNVYCRDNYHETRGLTTIITCYCAHKLASSPMRIISLPFSILGRDAASFLFLERHAARSSKNLFCFFFEIFFFCRNFSRPAINSHISLFVYFPQQQIAVLERV